MEVLSIKDLNETDAVRAIRQARRTMWGENMSVEAAREIYSLIGGRLSILMSLAKRKVSVRHLQLSMRIYARMSGTHASFQRVTCRTCTQLQGTG